MEDQSLLHRVCNTYEGYAKLGHEAFDADGATFVRMRETPRHHDGNHIAAIACQTPAEIDRLLTRVEREFAGYHHRHFRTDPFTPPSVTARLALEDYKTAETLQLVLEGELQARPQDVDIRLVDSDDDWAALRALNGLDWRETMVRRGDTYDEAMVAQFVAGKRAQTPHVRWWLARVNSLPRAYFGSWPGENGVGMIEDLFTHPEYRHRGLATALIAHCVADARARGAGSVLIGADPSDTPKHMYAAMGFRPLYLSRNFFKTGLPV